MQFICLFEKDNEENFNNSEQFPHMLYSCFHPRNGSYLEREDERDKFKVLPSLDDTSPSDIYIPDRFILLLEDLNIVLEETHKARDTEMTLHILELIVLCKFCVWNPERCWLNFFPWGDIRPPVALPENVKESISGLAPILEK